MIIETSETRLETIPGSGAREWTVKIGIRARAIDMPIIVKAILLPFLKSINTIMIQHKALTAAIIPCKETIGIVKLPIVRIPEFPFVVAEIQ